MNTPLLTVISLSEQAKVLLYNLTLRHGRNFTVSDASPNPPLIYRLHHLIGIVEAVKNKIDSIEDREEIVAKGGYYAWACSFLDNNVVRRFDLYSSVLESMKVNTLLKENFEFDWFNMFLNITTMIDKNEANLCKEILADNVQDYNYLKGLFK